MTSKNLVHAVVAAALMVGALAGGHAIKPTVHIAESLPKVDLERIFPTDFGEWQLDRNVPATIISPDVEAMLSKLYAQTLSRTYVNAKGERIMLSVAYGGDQSDATRTHRPDVCYPAQGFQIVSAKTGSFAMPWGNLPVRHMKAVMGPRNEPVSFWFAVGERTAVTGTEQKLAQLSYGLKGQIPDGMLVRVSNIDRDEDASYALHHRFVVAMQQAMPAEWQSRVFGKQLVK